MKDVKGFLSDKEAKKLQELFLKVHHLGSVLEIGTYCGKSALNFSEVAKDVNGLIYTIDHHTGSEEHQRGEEYHDSELFDERLKKFNTLPEFLNNLKSSFEVKKFKKGEVIFPQGQIADGAYVVISGLIGLKKGGQKKSIRIYIFTIMVIMKKQQ